MFRKLVLWLIKLISWPLTGKIYAKSYFTSKRKGKFVFDTRWIEFVDYDVKRKYIIRPTGMPVSLIVDELATITGSIETAMDIYKKFGMACDAASKKNVTPFKVTALTLEDFNS